jgi:hypothetical protein
MKDLLKLIFVFILVCLVIFTFPEPNTSPDTSSVPPVKLDIRSHPPKYLKELVFVRHEPEPGMRENGGVVQNEEEESGLNWWKVFVGVGAAAILAITAKHDDDDE